MKYLPNENWKEPGPVAKVYIYGIPGDWRVIAIPQVDFTFCFERLLKDLGAWINENNEDILHAFLTVRNADLLFLVVQRGKGFNEDLADLLTDLEIRIAQDESYKPLNLSVMAVPNTPYEAFSTFMGNYSLEHNPHANRE